MSNVAVIAMTEGRRGKVTTTVLYGACARPYCHLKPCRLHEFQGLRSNPLEQRAPPLQSHIRLASARP